MLQRSVEKHCRSIWCIVYSCCHFGYQQKSNRFPTLNISKLFFDDSTHFVINFRKQIFCYFENLQATGKIKKCQSSHHIFNQYNQYQNILYDDRFIGVSILYHFIFWIIIKSILISHENHQFWIQIFHMMDGIDGLRHRNVCMWQRRMRNAEAHAYMLCKLAGMFLWKSF